MWRQEILGENKRYLLCGAKKAWEKMYVTRPRSMYKKSPSVLSLLPPEGPNCGILVIQDEEAEKYMNAQKCVKKQKLFRPPN